jgi:hypothetical protein
MSGRKLKQQLKRSAKAGGDGATAMVGVEKSGVPLMKRWEKRKAAKRALKQAKKAGAWSPNAPPPSRVRHPLPHPRPRRPPPPLHMRPPSPAAVAVCASAVAGASDDPRQTNVSLLRRGECVGVERWTI